MQVMEKLLKDNNTMVLGSAVAAFTEVRASIYLHGDLCLITAFYRSSTSIPFLLDSLGMVLISGTLSRCGLSRVGCISFDTLYFKCCHMMIFYA